MNGLIAATCVSESITCKSILFFHFLDKDMLENSFVYQRRQHKMSLDVPQLVFESLLLTP